MTLEAALSRPAQAVPSATVQMTGQETARAGSGFQADPYAVTAPEITPRTGGNRVKGRVKRTQMRARASNGRGIYRMRRASATATAAPATVLRKLTTS